MPANNANHTELKTELVDKLMQLPKPVTRQNILDAASFLQGKEAVQFVDWLEVNGESLLARLNGR